jgi:hypothetical protein
MMLFKHAGLLDLERTSSHLHRIEELGTAFFLSYERGNQFYFRTKSELSW